MGFKQDLTSAFTEAVNAAFETEGDVNSSLDTKLNVNGTLHIQYDDKGKVNQTNLEILNSLQKDILNLDKTITSANKYLQEIKQNENKNTSALEKVIAETELISKSQQQTAKMISMKNNESVKQGEVVVSDLDADTINIHRGRIQKQSSNLSSIRTQETLQKKDIQALLEGAKSTQSVKKGTVTIINNFHNKHNTQAETLQSYQYSKSKLINEALALSLSKGGNIKQADLNSTDVKTYQSKNKSVQNLPNEILTNYYETKQALSSKGYLETEIDSLLGITQKSIEDMAQTVMHSIETGLTDISVLVGEKSKKINKLMTFQEYKLNEFQHNPNNIKLAQQAQNGNTQAQTKLHSLYENALGKEVSDQYIFNVMREQGAEIIRPTRISTPIVGATEWIDQNKLPSQVSKTQSQSIHKHINSMINQYEQGWKGLEDLFEAIDKGTANIPTDGQGLAQFKEKLIQELNRLIQLGKEIDIATSQANKLQVTNRKTGETTSYQSMYGNYKYTTLHQKGERSKGLSLTSKVLQYVDPELQNAEDIRQIAYAYTQNYFKEFTKVLNEQMTVQMLQHINNDKNKVPKNVVNQVQQEKQNFQPSQSLKYFTPIDNEMQSYLPQYKSSPTNIPTAITNTKKDIVENGLIFNDDTQAYEVEDNMQLLHQTLDELVKEALTCVELTEEGMVVFKQEFLEELQNFISSGKPKNGSTSAFLKSFNNFIYPYVAVHDTLDGMTYVDGHDALMQTYDELNDTIADIELNIGKGWARKLAKFDIGLDIERNSIIAKRLSENLPTSEEFIKELEKKIFEKSFKEVTKELYEISYDNTDNTFQEKLQFISHIVASFDTLMQDLIENLGGSEKNANNLQQLLRHKSIRPQYLQKAQDYDTVDFKERTQIFRKVDNAVWQEMGVDYKTIEKIAAEVYQREFNRNEHIYKSASSISQPIIDVPSEEITTTAPEVTTVSQDSVNNSSEAIEDISPMVEDIANIEHLTIQETKAVEQIVSELKQDNNEDSIDNGSSANGNENGRGGHGGGGNPPIPPNNSLNNYPLNLPPDENIPSEFKPFLERSVEQFAKTQNIDSSKVNYDLTHTTNDSGNMVQLNLKLYVDNGLTQTIKQIMRLDEESGNWINDDAIISTKDSSQGSMAQSQKNKLTNFLNSLNKKELDYLGTGLNIDGQALITEDTLTNETTKQDFQTKINRLKTHINKILNEGQEITDQTINELYSQIQSIDKALKDARKQEISEAKELEKQHEQQTKQRIETFNKLKKEYESIDPEAFKDLNDDNTNIVGKINTILQTTTEKINDEIVQKLEDNLSELKKNLNIQDTPSPITSKNLNKITNNEKQVIDFLSKLDKYEKNNPKAFVLPEYRDRFDKIRNSVKSAYNSPESYLDKSTLDNAKRDLAKFTSEVEKANLSGKTLGKTLGDLFSRWSGTALVGMAFRKGLQYLRQMWEAVKDVDRAMTELRKVTDEVGSTYDRYLKSAGNTARQLGVSLSDIVSSTADFARLGYSLADSAELSKVATVYKNVADGIDISTATGDIVSAMKAFSISAEDAMFIADMYNEVGNNFAISSAGIGQALTRSAASLQAAGNSLAQSIALVTAGNEILQDPETMGTALKVISLRIRGAKADLEDMGESTDDVCESTSKLRAEILALSGVDIMLDDNTFKSTYQILKEISEVYGNLTGVSQAALTEKLAGKTRSNALQAVLTNFETAEKAYQTAENSAGSAMQENAKYLDSIAGKTAKITASFQELSTAVLDADWVKPVLDGINGILNGLTAIFNFEIGDFNPFNALTVGLSSVAGLLEATGHSFELLKGDSFDTLHWGNPFESLFRGLLGGKDFYDTNQIIDVNLIKKLTGGTEAGTADFISAALEGVDALTNKYQELDSTSAQVIIDMITDNEQLNTSVEALIEATKQHNAEIKATGVQAKIAAVGVTALKAAASAGLTLLATLVISGIAQAIDTAMHQVENAKAELDEIAEKWQNASKSLSDNKSNYKNISEEFIKLSKGVSDTGKNIALTSTEYERYLELSEQLYQINPELSHTFDEQGNVLITFTGTLAELNNEFDRYFAQVDKANKIQILQNRQTVTEDINKLFNDGTQYTGWDIGIISNDVAELVLGVFSPILGLIDLAGNLERSIVNIFRYNIQNSTGTNLRRLREFTFLNEINPDEESIGFDLGRTGSHSDFGTFLMNAEVLKDAGFSEVGFWQSIPAYFNGKYEKMVMEDLEQGEASLLRTYQKNLEDELNREFEIKYKPVIQAYVELYTNYDKFETETQSAIQNVIDNIDYSFVNEYFADENGTVDFTEVEKWTDDLVNYFDNEDMTSAVNSVLKLNQQYEAGKISVEDYQYRVNELNDTIQSLTNNDTKATALIVDTMGADKYLERIEEIRKKAKDTKFEFEISDAALDEFINSLDKSEAEIFFKLLNSDTSDYADFDEIREEIESIARNIDIVVSIQSDVSNFKMDYENYTGEFKDSVSKFDNALNNMKSNSTISYEDMMGLVELDSSLIDDFVLTADGYVIATNKLVSAREKFVLGFTEDAEKNYQTALENNANAQANIDKLIVEQSQAQKDFNEADTILEANKNNTDAQANYTKAYNHLKEVSAELQTQRQALKDSQLTIDEYAVLLNDIGNASNNAALGAHSFDEAISQLSTHLNAINNVKLDAVTFGHITASTLQSLEQTYPQLKQDIADYLASSMIEADNQKLIKAAEEQYQKTRDGLKAFFVQQLESSEDYWSDWKSNNEEVWQNWVEYCKKVYKEDFENYKTFQEMKEGIENKSIKYHLTPVMGQPYNTTATAGIGDYARDLNLGDFIDISTGEVTSLYIDFKMHADEDDKALLEVIDKMINQYRTIVLGLDIEGDADNVLKDTEDNSHIISTPPEIEQYRKELAELEHRQNMGEDVLDELDAKLAEGVAIYGKHKDQFLSDYNSTLERLHNMTNEFYNRDLSIIDHQLAMGEITHRDYYNRLVELHEKYYKDKADFQQEDWQLEEKIRQERLSLISEEQSLLQKQKDELIKYETDAYDTQIQLLQEKIDKNNEISNSISEQNDLLEAQKALLEASQRTKYVYREGQGFVYERDEEAFYNAKTQYDETLRNIENNALQAQIDRLQKESEESITIIENFFNNLNDILEKQVNPDMDNDKAVWSEFFSADQISALETILGQKDNLEELYKQNRTVTYNGETYRYIDDDAIARLAENFMPVLMQAYKTEVEQTAKLMDTDTLARTKGFTDAANKVINDNSVNTVTIQQGAVQITVQGNASLEVADTIRSVVYQALDDITDKITLKAEHEKGKR